MNPIDAAVPRRGRTVALFVTLLLLVSLHTGAGMQRAEASIADSPCWPYWDVDTSDPHCENILWLTGQGITKPATEYEYNPSGSVTRGSMAAFLFRFANPGVAQPRCTSKPFPDVSTSNRFCGYISWAEKSGIASGYPDGSYGPNKAVTRGAMAAFLHRIARPGQGASKCTSKPFTDVRTSETFCGAISWMKKQGITYGVGGGKYGTTLKVTRGAMASFLHRVFDYRWPNNFYDGITRVGGKVVPGLYRAKVPEGETCYWERLSGSSGSFDDIIANELIGGYALIQVEAGDRYVRSRGCGTWRLASKTPAWNFGSKFPGEGMFIVGADIRPGEYRQNGRPGQSCYWERSTRASGNLDHVIENDLATGASYVTIKPTDKVFIAKSCGTFTRVG